MDKLDIGSARSFAAVVVNETPFDRALRTVKFALLDA